MANASDWFGGLSLASKYGIVLGSLIFLVLVAGFIKLCVMRRRLTKHIKQQKLEAEGKVADDEFELNKRELDEGDLFGVRAIESGFYGGVAQSRPGSVFPSNSSRTTLALDANRTPMPETPRSAAVSGRQVEKLAPEGHDYAPHSSQSMHSNHSSYDSRQMAPPQLGIPPQAQPLAPSPKLAYESNPDILFQAPVRASPRILLPRQSLKDLTAASGRPSPLDLGTARASYFSEVALSDNESEARSLPVTPQPHRTHMRTPTMPGHGLSDHDAMSHNSHSGGSNFNSPRQTAFPHESPRNRPSDNI